MASSPRNIHINVVKFFLLAVPSPRADNRKWTVNVTFSTREYYPGMDRLRLCRLIPMAIHFLSVPTGLSFSKQGMTRRLLCQYADLILDNSRAFSLRSKVPLTRNQLRSRRDRASKSFEPKYEKIMSGDLLPMLATYCQPTHLSLHTEIESLTRLSDSTDCMRTVGSTDITPSTGHYGMDLSR